MLLSGLAGAVALIGDRISSFGSRLDPRRCRMTGFVRSFGAGRSGGVKRPGWSSEGERWLIIGGLSGGVRCTVEGTAGLCATGVARIDRGRALAVTGFAVAAESVPLLIVLAFI